MSAKVLIADDSAFARRALRQVLEEQSFECIEAADGEEALVQWREHRPALILLDLNMPKMTGYKVLETMKEEGSDCAILVVSADVQPKARERVVALGARAMIRKPLDKSKVDTIIGFIRQRLSEPEATAESTPEPQQVSPLDQEKLEALSEIVNVGMGQAAAALAEMLGTFLEISIPKAQTLDEYLVEQRSLDNVEGIMLVQQAFTGDLRGEAIAVFDERRIDELRSLLAESSRESTDNELILEMSNILIGAALTSIGSQLSAKIRFGRPSLLGRGGATLEALCTHKNAASHLVITIGIKVESRHFSVTLLVVLPERARARLHHALDALLRAPLS